MGGKWEVGTEDERQIKGPPRKRRERERVPTMSMSLAGVRS